MNTTDNHPLQTNDVSQSDLLAQIEDLKITMAIKEEDAYLRGRNDCIEQYFSQMKSQSQFHNNHKSQSLHVLDSVSKSVWD